MALITFQDLPSTSTPLNATNLNNNFNELNNNKSNLLITENITSDSTSINANTESTLTIGISKTGYTPLGILMVDISQNNVDLLKYSIYSNNAYVRVKNLTSGSISITCTIKMLYIKN